MEYPYSQKFEPPAPVIKITRISPAYENNVFSHQAMPSAKQQLMLTLLHWNFKACLKKL
jgi:hypothetical protein